MGVAGIFVLGFGAAQAGDNGGYYTEAEGLVSLRRNAVVTIGGEIRVDYSIRRSKTRGAARRDSKTGDLSVRQANLRVQADVHPNISAFFKIDLSSNAENNRDRDDIMEEALLVMRAVGGTGLGFFAGKGKAPYGQDITLGIIQSYTHSANHADSAEGPIFIVDPPESDAPGARLSGPMRPGQFERTFLAGASYDWDQRWRVEVAAFRPERGEYRRRLASRDDHGSSDIGMAGRVWWSPTEELALEASGVWARSGDMANIADRTDVPSTARGERNAYALSLGFDWRRGPWRVFGEFQRGWDWNFTKGYDTRTIQAGMSRDFGSGWRLGGMVETLRVDNAPSAKTVDDYYKLTFNVRYAFTSGLFILAEYGHEWHRREVGGGFREKRDGDFMGIRLGMTF